jgi:pimeloyl-ACP methyl ester carboxylesterase
VPGVRRTGVPGLARPPRQEESRVARGRVTLVAAAATLLWLAAGPGSQRIVVAPAESLHVSVEGAGTPVVLVPGMLGSGFAYRKLVPLLVAEGYETVVIEPLGIGGSSRPERANYSLTAQSDRIAAVLDTLGLTHVIMVAHTLGASMVYRLAVHRPDLVGAVLSLDGGPAEAAATPGFRRAMAFAPWIKLFGGVRLIRGRIHKSLLAASGDTSWVTDSVVDGYVADAKADLDGTLKAYLGMAHAREPERLAPELERIHCPVRLLMGGAPHHGGISSPEVDELRQDLTSFTIETVPHAGLFLQEERPDVVAVAVTQLAGTIVGTRPGGSR